MSTPIGSELLGAAIIERDTNDDTLMTWSFPSVDSDMERVMLARCSLPRLGEGVQTHFSRFRDTWQYFFAFPATAQQHVALGRVDALAVCVLSKGYDPEKFLALAKVLAATYVATGSAAKVMEGYLSVFTTGQFAPSGTGVKPFNANDHDPRRAVLAGSLKAVVKGFKQSSILLWVSVLLKRRIAVYGARISDVAAVIRALPLFAWHRQDWGILAPYVTMSPLELDALKKSVVFIAGFTDPAIKSRDDVYDILVDIPSRSIVVAEHAQDKFLMGSYHKELAGYLLACCEDQSMDDQGMIKGVSAKTKELINNMKNMAATDGKLTHADMDSKNIPQNMRAFLFELSVVEGVTKL